MIISLNGTPGLSTLNSRGGTQGGVVRDSQQNQFGIKKRAKTLNMSYIWVSYKTSIMPSNPAKSDLICKNNEQISALLPFNN